MMLVGGACWNPSSAAEDAVWAWTTATVRCCSSCCACCACRRASSRWSFHSSSAYRWEVQVMAQVGGAGGRRWLA